MELILIYAVHNYQLRHESFEASLGSLPGFRSTQGEFSRGGSDWQCDS